MGERGSRKVSFVPIASEHLGTAMEALYKLAGDEAMPVLLRTALAHAEFESLHPLRTAMAAWAGC